MMADLKIGHYTPGPPQKAAATNTRKKLSEPVA
jgi:hypothetical protein